MHRLKHLRCFWHAFDPDASALLAFGEAALNVPIDPIAAEVHTAFQCFSPGRGMLASPNSTQRHQPGFTAKPTTLSAYEHGQNAARRGKHFQACPFDTGTVDWRQWRDGFLAAFRSGT